MSIKALGVLASKHWSMRWYSRPGWCLSNVWHKIFLNVCLMWEGYHLTTVLSRVVGPSRG